MGYVNKTYLSTQFKNFADKIAKVFSKIGHTHLKSDITDFPTSMPANGGNAATVGGHTVGVNVPSNAKFTDTTYSKLSEFTDDVGYVKNTDARLTNARPASDVYAWAKASTKPTYTANEVGLGNVDNTADSAKSVKYATSAGSASSALKATGVVDYGSPANTIQIGYGGAGISGDAIKYIAGYTVGNGSDVDARIKDVNKDALKSWLGLGSLAYSSATIPTIPSSLPANGGNSATVNGHTVNSDVPANAKFTDTTYGVATSSTLGLVKSGTDITVDSSGNVSINDDSHNHVISNVDGLQSALDGKAASSHTHNYAGSSSAGGSANTALGLSPSTISNIDELDSFLSGNAVMKYAKASNCNIGFVSNDGLVISLPWSSTFGAQIAIDDQSNWMGIRTKNNGTWNSWSKIALESEIDSKLSGKANSSHTHTKSQITDFPTSLPASDVYAWAKASSKPSYSWSEITSKPSTFTPASHTHDYLPLSGGTLNGQIHFNDNSLPVFDGSIPYLV